MFLINSAFSARSATETAPTSRIGKASITSISSAGCVAEEAPGLWAGMASFLCRSTVQNIARSKDSSDNVFHSGKSLVHKEIFNLFEVDSSSQRRPDLLSTPNVILPFSEALL